MWTAGCPQSNLLLGFFAKAIFRKKIIKIKKKIKKCFFLFFYIDDIYLKHIWAKYEAFILKTLVTVSKRKLVPGSNRPCRLNYFMAIFVGSNHQL